MNMTDLPVATAAATPEVFQQLGLLTRQLHDALNQLGLMPRLQQSAEGLSDARSRLSYIAGKTGEAADKVLNAVDLAKEDQASIMDAARRIAAGDTAGVALASEVAAAATRTDKHLTDIMLAQDFHDLTGQVVAKVAALAIDLEDSLVKLLVQAAHFEQPGATGTVDVTGPSVDTANRSEVVANQGEVDDLLASLGF